MKDSTDLKSVLLELSHDLGAEHRELAILGEGNTSARYREGTFLVKASGSNLGTLSEKDLVECRFADLLPMLDQADASDGEVEKGLEDCRLDPAAKRPSVETLFHSYLLALPGVNFVGHVHSIAVNGILCSPRARDFAEHRLFPDEIVCCGPASVSVPYTDPGLMLSRAIRHGCQDYIARHGIPPRVILLENHGLVALGSTPAAVKAAIYMAEKSARIFQGAAALGGPVFLDGQQVARIAGRRDEHHRQRALGL